jgi:hypothetical protein
MRSWTSGLALLLLLLSVASPALGQQTTDEAPDGPPPPLAGVPLTFLCEARLHPGHPLLSPQPGQDLRDLAGVEADDERALSAWLELHLCGLIWQQLEASGAHAQPPDVRLPARAVLEVRLLSAEMEGTRVVDQRVGSSVMPVAVPHWALESTWMIRFGIHRERDGTTVVGEPALDFTARDRAEQEDYTPLRVGALLRANVQRSFSGLPRLLADEGGLGDLLFSEVDPRTAPSQLGVSGALADGFWNLLAPVSEHRHDALAFYLASDRPSRDARIGLARWFVLNDSDVAVRRDAMAWLLLQEPPPDAERDLSPEMVALLRWLLSRDTSPRMRAAVAEGLVGRTGDGVRELLLIASSDHDRRVADVANGALRRFEPATAAEMAELARPVSPPRVPGWTAALDGRVALPDGNPDRHLLILATAAGGPAAETWLTRWALHGETGPGDGDWTMEGWIGLAGHPSPRVRRATLERLTSEVSALIQAERIVLDRVRLETEPELRIMAIEALDRKDGPGAAGALLAASRDESPKVRAVAAMALAEVPGDEATERLELLARGDPDGKVRRKATRALRKREFLQRKAGDAG